ncbi:response regulator [Aspergillus undulatus]|uniref:response regulator n=1 Tax=Aspergillus undulatus TaxID=1810928 RepID=UPI003CCCC1D6
MSERRWSTRLKAKLLRRSSTSSKASKSSRNRLTTTTTNTSASTDIHPQLSQQSQGAADKSHHTLSEDRAEEQQPAEPESEPNFDTTTTTATTTTTPPISTSSPNVAAPSHPPPPLSSASRPSISSFAESQYTPDELVSASGSPGGQYFVVPEYRRPTSPSPTQRPEEPVNQESTPTASPSKGQSLPEQLNHNLTPTRRRFEPSHDRERARSGSSRKSFPSELLNFPLPPSRKSDAAPATPSPSLPKPDRSSIPPGFSSHKRHSSGPAESPAPLLAVTEKSAINTYQSFPLSTTTFNRPNLGSRKQSLLPASHQHLVSSLLDTGSFSEPQGLGGTQGLGNNGLGNSQVPTMGSGMGLRKIWVKRPGGSATLLPTSEDALVDELRDMVVRKYANSLGKTFDAPDIIIRISTREGARLPTPDRILSPEEPLWSVVDSYYPGGQNVTEALLIEIPQRRTPKPSPRHNVYLTHSEPGEHGDYFPLMPANVNVPTPPAQQAHSATSGSTHAAPSISILTTGHAPPLPSPNGRPRLRRPPPTRHTTHSPTLLENGSPKDPTSAQSQVPPQPTPPAPAPAPPPESPQAKIHTPPARVASPRTSAPKTKKTSRGTLLNAAFGGLIEGTVPPINVLIVEDNVINQKLLEAFMKRLSVRWKCAANGAEAVTKWREGGFHLVLMDIQLPVMNGLDATKEIRRLERLNGIGVFPKKSGSSADNTTVQSPVTAEDTLHDLSLFKSPVIIVALTASSLQSDRHEALAAGCNDFLTKPVRFEWLEQKVTEWGCMQALIDFEGWRKWRGFADSHSDSGSASGRSSPATARGSGSASASRKTSPIASPSPSAKKLDEKNRHLRRDLLDDSPDSGDGSDSPASLHTDRPSPMNEGAV